MAKLADAADLKSAGAKSPVGVRFPLPAPVNSEEFRYCGGLELPDLERLDLERLAPFLSSRRRCRSNTSPPNAWSRPDKTEPPAAGSVPMLDSVDNGAP